MHLTDKTLYYPEKIEREYNKNIFAVYKPVNIHEISVESLQRSLHTICGLKTLFRNFDK